jgi:hypothetical protein
MSDGLDILVELALKFGHQLQEQYSGMLAIVLPSLDDNRAGIRKRALHCIGACSEEGARAGHTSVCSLLMSSSPTCVTRDL